LHSNAEGRSHRACAAKDLDTPAEGTQVVADDGVKKCPRFRLPVASIAQSPAMLGIPQEAAVMAFSKQSPTEPRKMAAINLVPQMALRVAVDIEPPPCRGCQDLCSLYKTASRCHTWVDPGVKCFDVEWDCFCRWCSLMASLPPSLCPTVEFSILHPTPHTEASSRHADRLRLLRVG
jgi:hypothetical protein